MSVTLVSIEPALGPDDLSALDAIAARLDAGAVVALPTETVYGLCASMADPHALARVARIKERPINSPFPLFVPDLETAMEWGEIPRWALPMLEDLWPGPLTVVLRARRPETKVLGSDRTVGIRIPDHPVPRRLTQSLKHPIVGTSANRHRRPPLLTAEDVFTELGPEVDFIIRFPGDGSGRASTVVDLSTDEPVILREGEVSVDQIRAYREAYS